MREQSLASHRGCVPVDLFVPELLAVFTSSGALDNIDRAVGRGSGRGEDLRALQLAVSVAIASSFLRVFALTAQDRARGAEGISGRTF